MKRNMPRRSKQDKGKTQREKIPQFFSPVQKENGQTDQGIHARQYSTSRCSHSDHRPETSSRTVLSDVTYKVGGTQGLQTRSGAMSMKCSDEGADRKPDMAEDNGIVEEPMQIDAHIKSNAHEPKTGKRQSYKYMPYKILCRGSESVINAPKSHATFQKLNPNFNFDYVFAEVRRGQGEESFIPNLGAPVKLYKDKTIYYDVKPKIKTKPTDYCRLLVSTERASVDGQFFISMKSEHVKHKITHMDGAHYKNSLLAVYFLQGEKLGVALEKDGRFLSKVIHSCILRSVQTKEAAVSIDDQANTHKDETLYIEWDGKADKSITDSENDSDGSDSDTCTSHASLNVLQSLGNIEDMFPVIAEKYKSLDFSKKEKSKAKAVGKILAKPFSSTYENLPVEVINRYQRSVGIIYIDRISRVEQKPIGTGFILNFPYVLTNRHVLNIAVKLAGDDPVKICFNYTRNTIASQEHIQKYSFKQINSEFMIHFESPVENLDYVVLELEDEDKMETDEAVQPFPSLAELISPFPMDHYALNILGHHHGHALHMDPRCSLKLKKLKNIPVYFKLGSIDEETAQSWNSDDHISYDTNMFEGSSGSPVFTSQGHLVALHTRGLFRQHASRSEFEQGVTLKSIIDDVKQQARDEEKKDIMSRIFPGRLIQV